MRDLRNALIGCTCVVFLSIAGVAIWTVRAYLPIVGIVLLVVLVLAVLLALAYAVEHLHRRYSRYEHVQISQYGSVLHRRDQIVQIAPYSHQAASSTEPETENVIEGDIEYDDPPALLPPLLTFAELLEEGIIQAAINRGEMILGYVASTHELRYGSWLDLYSAGNGGVSGSGKSTTTRFLLFQGVLAGAKLVMIDPHIGDPEESLAHQFLLLPPGIHQLKPCDRRDSDVLKRVQWLSKELARRELSGVKTPFLIFVIDEFNSVMRRAEKETREKLTKLLLDIEQEGRKFGMFALLIGQKWAAQDLGGADIRASLASKMGHRFSDEGQAIRFMGSKYGKQLPELETGHWFFYDTKGKYAEMITPDTLSSDGRIIAELMGQGQERTTETSYETWLKPRESTLQLPERTTGALPTQKAAFYAETTEEITLSSSETRTESTELTALARQIMAMQADGAQKAEIMRQVWGVNPGGSQEYREAQVKYQEVMRFIANQIGA